MIKEKIFISGGAGFIGANLVKYLLNKGRYSITVYDNLSVGLKTNLNDAIGDSKHLGKVRFVKGDILDYAGLSKAVKGHNVVVHLAAHTRVVESLNNPKENFRINCIGTFNILEAARKNGIKKFIFASSNAVLGEQIPPLTERMIPRPISTYGANKLYGEALCSTYFYSYGLKTISLRFANAYGPYSEHKTSVIAKFIKRVREGKPLEIYGDGKQTRDFIYVSDICQAIYLSLDFHFANSDDPKTCTTSTFQIASGVGTKINDLAKNIFDLSRSFNLSVPRIRYLARRKGEIRKNFSDIKMAKKLLNYNPSVKLKDGLRKTWGWFDKINQKKA